MTQIVWVAALLSQYLCCTFVATCDSAQHPRACTWWSHTGAGHSLPDTSRLITYTNQLNKMPFLLHGACYLTISHAFFGCVNATIHCEACGFVLNYNAIPGKHFPGIISVLDGKVPGQLSPCSNLLVLHWWCVLVIKCPAARLPNLGLFPLLKDISMYRCWIV